MGFAELSVCFSQRARRGRGAEFYGDTEFFRITQRTQSIRGRKVFVTEVHKDIFYCTQNTQNSQSTHVTLARPLRETKILCKSVHSV